MARRIVEARRVEPIVTTARLADLVRKSIPGKWGPIDPATRTFQALRIAVNGELDHLDVLLANLSSWLNPGGRAAIISFHSLEDRRVKHAFRDDPELTVLTRKPITATAEEIQTNPRAERQTEGGRAMHESNGHGRNGGPNPPVNAARGPPAARRPARHRADRGPARGTLPRSATTAKGPVRGSRLPRRPGCRGTRGPSSRSWSRSSSSSPCW